MELTKYWEPLATAYNNIPFQGQDVTADLEAYVMDKTMDGLFAKLAQEEAMIRTDPQARVTELLQKVFGN